MDKAADEPYRITIPGAPIPWAAPRITRWGHYDKRSEHKQAVVIQLKSLDLTCLSGPISMETVFIMPIPKSFSGKKKKLINGTFHSVKSDITNLLKLSEDCLEKAGIIRNDSMICKTCAVKIYGEEPRTEITLTQITSTKDFYEESSIFSGSWSSLALPVSMQHGNDGIVC